MRPNWRSPDKGSPSYSLHISLISSKCIVKGIKFCDPKFLSFLLSGLERMKDTNKWLSDSHVTFSLMFVLSFFVSSLSYSNDTQRLFLQLLPEKYLGKPENPAVGHSILAAAVRRPRKIWWVVQNQGKSARVWFCCDAYFWGVSFLTVLMDVVICQPRMEQLYYISSFIRTSEVTA